MISVIISTYRPELLRNVSKNIEATIGVPFEIIAIENKGQMGLCKLYNIGAARAQFEMLCFAHEDIDIKTANWGRIVINTFEKNKNLGLLGVAGSLYKTVTPSHWSFAGATQETCVQNVIQRHGQSEQTHRWSNPSNEEISYVAAIDGLWFCTTKKIATEIPFDETTLTGFHGYDVDYSLSINSKYKVAVTFNILMEHFSEGGFNDSWIKDIIKVHNKWNHALPFKMKQYDRSFMEREETIAFKLFVKQMIGCNYSFVQILRLFSFQNRNFTFPFLSRIFLFLRIVKYKYL